MSAQSYVAHTCLLPRIPVTHCYGNVFRSQLVEFIRGLNIHRPGRMAQRSERWLGHSRAQ